MSEERKAQFELQDTNVAAGYVTSIVDIWHGDRNDPAVGIQRFIGVWMEDQLQNGDGEAHDPDFSSAETGRYGSKPTPRPVIWELLETVKESDREAEKQKNQHENRMSEGSSWRGDSEVKRLYREFMAAIDVLATDGENEEAWAAVEAYRSFQALAHEK